MREGPLTSGVDMCGVNVPAANLARISIGCVVANAMRYVDGQKICAMSIIRALKV